MPGQSASSQQGKRKAAPSVRHSSALGPCSVNTQARRRSFTRHVMTCAACTDPAESNTWIENSTFFPYFNMAFREFQKLQSHSGLILAPPPLYAMGWVARSHSFLSSSFPFFFSLMYALSRNEDVLLTGGCHRSPSNKSCTYFQHKIEVCLPSQFSHSRINGCWN